MNANATCSDGDHLRGLSEEQLAAVTSERPILHVVAGPGCGKTSVLTRRIADLVKRRQVQPKSICVVTFTNKAANELAERLDSLIGTRNRQQLIMGTFHSVCSRFLRCHGPKVGLSNGFTIVDASESRTMIKKIVKELDVESKPELLANAISWAKGRNETAEEYNVRHASSQEGWKRDVGRVYFAYGEELRRIHAVDFDDLIVLGLRLVQQHTEVVKHIDYVLVDEFQDTSKLQFELLRTLCSVKNNLTVVGDPDQSIFSWRAADTRIPKMFADAFENLTTLKLEQSYRSTSSIINCAMQVLVDDKTRQKKNVWTANWRGFPPFIDSFTSGEEEAEFVAREIARLQSTSKELLTWNDFAILIRSNSLSRKVEESLHRANIPYKMVGGIRFFDRTEIRDLLAYLSCAHSDGVNFLAFRRIANVPKRELGAVSMDAIFQAFEKTALSPLEILRRVSSGSRIDGLGKVSRRHLPRFLTLMESLQAGIREGWPIHRLLALVVNVTEYEEYLKKEYPTDWQFRWENVQELLGFSVNFTEAESLKGAETGGSASPEEILLAFFEAASLTAADVTTNKTAKSEMVTVSTLHASKGLEWPCVFIVAAETGFIPHSLCEKEGQIAEERRLLFVGMTRAKCLLYCTYALGRVFYGGYQRSGISPFLANLPGSMVTKVPPHIGRILQDLAHMLKRSLPTEAIASGQLLASRAVTSTQTPSAKVNFAAAAPGFQPASSLLRAKAKVATTAGAPAQAGAFRPTQPLRDRASAGCRKPAGRPQAVSAVGPATKRKATAKLPERGKSTAAPDIRKFFLLRQACDCKTDGVDG